VRGGAPGTRETDLLRPENTVDRVHAVLLTGGSAFGLDAAGGVMRWLDERGHGLQVGPARVPIVPAAVLFDLWVGDARIRPDAHRLRGLRGRASTRLPRAMSVPALGATVGKLFGIERAMKGGIGTASLKLGSFTVARWWPSTPSATCSTSRRPVMAGARERRRPGMGAPWMPAGRRRADTRDGRQATTIGVVATDARLTKAQANQLANLAHHGLSRAISPLTANDGDTLFALATGMRHAGDLSALGAMAAEVVARAIRNAVRAARSLQSPACLRRWTDPAILTRRRIEVAQHHAFAPRVGATFQVVVAVGIAAPHDGADAAALRRRVDRVTQRPQTCRSVRRWPPLLVSTFGCSPPTLVLGCWPRRRPPSTWPAAHPVPQSAKPTSVLATYWMMVAPPGEPVARRNSHARRPLAANTSVGAIELRGRLPAATRLAIGAPLASVGAAEKSVNWLFSRKPPRVMWKAPEAGLHRGGHRHHVALAVDHRDLRGAVLG
jgi:L-aminopeptidase/D-esterase-like protein